MTRALLEGEALDQAVAELDGWTVRDGKLHKEYVFADFVEAFAFMSGAAVHAWASIGGVSLPELPTALPPAGQGWIKPRSCQPRANRSSAGAPSVNPGAP